MEKVLIFLRNQLIAIMCKVRFLVISGLTFRTSQ